MPCARKTRSPARLGSGKSPHRSRAAAKAPGPEIRTSATPALPFALAKAKIVSMAGPVRQKDQEFIDSKNSALVFVCFSLVSRNSIASVVPIGFRIRRST